MGKLTVEPTPIDGLFTIDTDAFHDDRGTFARWFCADELKNILNGEQIVNVNFSHTKNKGTVRGMHFQYPPCAEIKMVRCIKGKVLDVVVDIRKDSPTFLKHFSIELTADNMKMLYIPKGFAHGFQCLENDSEIMYLVTSYYSAEKESGLNALDSKLNISWPFPVTNMSDKDKNRSMLDDNFDGIELP